MQVYKLGSSGPGVRRLQEKLKANGATLVVDGEFGASTKAAVVAYQQWNGLQPDGVAGPLTQSRLGVADIIVGSGGGALKVVERKPLLVPDKVPNWYRVALGESDQELVDADGKQLASANSAPVMGRNVVEKAGAAQNPRIIEYLQTCNDEYTRDEIAWCGAFVNWCLIEAGIGRRAPVPERARSWLDFGVDLTEPRLGAVTVIYNPPTAAESHTTTSGFHVGFFAGREGDTVRLLGGNQGGGKRVTISSYGWTVKGYRWPAA